MSCSELVQCLQWFFLGSEVHPTSYPAKHWDKQKLRIFLVSLYEMVNKHHHTLLSEFEPGSRHFYVVEIVDTITKITYACKHE